MHSLQTLHRLRGTRGGSGPSQSPAAIGLGRGGAANGDGRLMSTPLRPAGPRGIAGPAGPSGLRGPAGGRGGTARMFAVGCGFDRPVNRLCAPAACCCPSAAEPLGMLCAPLACVGPCLTCPFMQPLPLQEPLEQEASGGGCGRLQACVVGAGMCGLPTKACCACWAGPNSQPRGPVATAPLQRYTPPCHLAAPALQGPKVKHGLSLTCLPDVKPDHA